jgi:nucleoid-associated protein YejK
MIAFLDGQVLSRLGFHGHSELITQQLRDNLQSFGYSQGALLTFSKHSLITRYVLYLVLTKDSG